MNLKHYDADQPCVRCKTRKRYVSNRACVKCEKAKVYARRGVQMPYNDDIFGDIPPDPTPASAKADSPTVNNDLVFLSPVGVHRLKWDNSTNNDNDNSNFEDLL